MKRSRKAKQGKDYYGQIDSAIRRYEDGFSYQPISLSWISDRIEWCWKFRHITEEQCNLLCDRMTALYKSGLW